MQSSPETKKMVPYVAAALAPFAVVFLAGASHGDSPGNGTGVRSENGRRPGFVKTEATRFEFGDRRGVVSLAVSAERIVLGDRFNVEIAVVNTSQHAYDIYYQKGGIQLDGEYRVLSQPSSILLAMFDERGQMCVADQFARTAGSMRGVVANDWRRLPPRGRFAKREWLVAGRGGPMPSREYGSRVPAGKYYLQAIFLDRFLSECPRAVTAYSQDKGPPTADVKDGSETSLLHWFESYHEAELFRSNTVEVEFVVE